ncbi:MAG: metallopeptidase TldD-related protein, partial [Butyricimonas faecihominis]
SVEEEDKSPCFSEASVEKYYEPSLPDEKQEIDLKIWEKRLNEISSVFKAMPDLQEASASLDFQVVRTYLVNTEGTEVVQNRTHARIILSVTAKASDGMILPLNKDYFAYELKDLPDNSVMVADARAMIKKIRELVNAPVADPYTGPAVLSGAASGVFFHEIFGHRLEASRMTTGGETFKKMVGEVVLPKDFQVYNDPTLTRYADIYMNGHYLYDDEGVKSRRVDNVVNGVLKEFLLGRKPIDGFPRSNAHGRTGGGGDAVSRQSNLIVETRVPHAESELRRMLIMEAKKQGKEYGYYFKTVVGGFTLTGEGNSLNSFNVNPVEVYRVYVDGRPDQLVRGVELIGTPLSMFSNIVAAGDKSSVFTGMCGAESGWVPVTACSPMIFVNKIETQRRNQERDLPPILPAP